MAVFWMLLRLELCRWTRRGQAPVLWWRDDDTRHASPPLERLLAAAERHGAPLTLAVVPAGSLDGLVSLLEAWPAVIVAQHGVTHSNARLPGEPADEFADGLLPGAIAMALMAGAARLTVLPRRIGLFVPPWNRITPALGPALILAGLRRVSSHGHSHAERDGVARLDTHFDLLRWRGGARFRGEARFLWRFLRLLRARRRARAWSDPIGLLTHHLDHDSAAWRFLEAFLGFTVTQRCRWDCAARILGAELAGPEPAASCAEAAAAG